VRTDEDTYSRELAAVAIERGAVQNADELAELIDELRRWENFGYVRLALEIGVYLGGTLWLWKTLWPQAEVVGIDNMTLMGKCEACERRRAHNNCPNMMLELNSHDAHLLKRDSADVPAHFQDDIFDFLHIDGDHSLAGVRADFDNYSPMVKEGGRIILHDAALEGSGVKAFCGDTLSKLRGALLIHCPDSPSITYGVGVIPV